MTEQQQIKQLTESVAYLSCQLQEMRDILHRAGLLSPWRTPKEAESILGVSESAIRHKIREARLNPRKSDLKAGKHFKFKGKSHYLVNVEAWGQLQAIPPEAK